MRVLGKRLIKWKPGSFEVYIREMMILITFIILCLFYFTFLGLVLMIKF
jgi:hypothetical protein